MNEDTFVSSMVGIAQLVRAPGCGPGGHRFESDYPPHLRIAKSSDFAIFFNRILGSRQAVRHSTLTAASVGSNPASPAKNKSTSSEVLLFLATKRALRHMKNEAAFGYEAHLRCTEMLHTLCFILNISSMLRVCEANASCEPKASASLTNLKIQI